MLVEQQLHAYANGHELLASSVKLASTDQETIDRLSDMAGTLGPGEVYPPYLTGYPLPQQTHFVLARTWYDDAAPRAGCVLTHSLLIPMQAWRENARLATLRTLLVPFQKESQPRKLASLEMDEEARLRLPPVLGAERSAIAEATFLEERAPIVVFDCEDSETTALRLVQAMWPALRARFAFCTFTLQPRSISGREFDLLFAPAHARSRFAKWSGRRIEGDAASANEPRHRWSRGIVRSIFEDEEPSLVSDDPLGILRGDEAGESGRLRLALLWEELQERQHESSTAVLGMLDVLSSMRLDSVELRVRSEPLILDAATRASIEMGAEQGIQFLSVLVGKLPAGRPNGKTTAAITRAAFQLARRDPAAAVANVPFETTSFLGVRAITRGIGHALAEHGAPEIFGILSAAPHGVSARLLGASAPLCRAVVRPESQAPTTWWSTLASVATSASPVEKPRLRVRLLPLLREPAHVAVMKSLLTPLTPNQVERSIAALDPALRGPAADVFEQGIADVLLPTHREPLRRAILSESTGSHVPEHLLLRVLKPTRTDLSLLLATKTIGDGRRPVLLAEFLEQLSDGEVEQLVRDAEPLMEQAVFLLALQSPPLAPREVARVLRTLELPARKLQVIAETVIGELGESDSVALASAILPRLLLGDLRELLSIGTLMEKRSSTDALRRMGSARVVEMFVPERRAFDGDRQSAIMEVIDSAPSLRSTILEHIDEVARRLAGRRQADLSVDAVAIWARLLSDAWKRNERHALRADVFTLRYALERRPRGGSALVLATFAHVYEVAGSKESSVDVDALFSFFDWDRAKALRIELINAYLRSSWPSGDLMVVAERAGIGRKVLKRLSREHRGDEFMDRMKLDLGGRRDAEGARALRAILEFERNPPNRYEWD